MHPPTWRRPSVRPLPIAGLLVILTITMVGASRREPPPAHGCAAGGCGCPPTAASCCCAASPGRRGAEPSSPQALCGPRCRDDSGDEAGTFSPTTRLHTFLTDATEAGATLPGLALLDPAPALPVPPPFDLPTPPPRSGVGPRAL